MATKTARKNSKKAKTTPKAKVSKTKDVNFTKSINRIKDTATKVNSQVLETATDVMDDLKINGEQLRETAVINVKEAIKKVNETVTFENLKETAQTINKYTIKTADEMVDGAIENGEKWQGVASKAVKGSLKLAAKQQDIVFTTLEEMKGHLAQTAFRFKKLLRSDK